MTTATTARADQLREDIAEYRQRMASNIGTHLFAAYFGALTKAEAELREIEAKS